MSGLAKVFLVINLVLAVIFLGTSATLFSVRKDFKNESETLTKVYKDNFEKQKAEIEKLASKVEIWANVISVQNAEIVNANAAKAELATKLSAAQTELTTAKTEVATKQSRVDALDGKVGELSSQITSLATRVQTSQEQLSATVAERSDALKVRNEQLLLNAESMEKVASLEVENKKLRDENELLRTQIVIAGVGKDGAVATGAAPMIAAKVLSVKEKKLVILSVGADDKVKEGMVFIVYRDNKYLGDVKIVNVYKDMAGAEVVHTVSGAEIKEGDDAKTKQLL
jgi:hypothetical protein